MPPENPAAYGMPPTPGGPAPGGPAGGGAPQQVPHQFARHIDPNNKVQMLLLQRIDKLTPEQGNALASGISPQAAAALKTIIPEVGFLIDMIPGAAGGVGAPGGMPAPLPPGGPGGPMPPMPSGGAGLPPPPMPGQQPSPAPTTSAGLPPRPRTRLAQVGA